MSKSATNNEVARYIIVSVDVRETANTAFPENALQYG